MISNHHKKHAHNDKPQLLVVTSTFPRWHGDSEPGFVYQLCTQLLDHFSITVIAPSAPKAKHREEMDGLNVVRYRYFINRYETLATANGGIIAKLRANPACYLLLPLFLLAQLITVARHVRTGRYAVIHCHWLIPQALVALLALRLASKQTPLVCTSHGGDLYALRGWPWQEIRKWIIKKLQALAVVSNAMRDDIISCYGNRHDFPPIKVAPMGVDLTHRFTPPNRPLDREVNQLLFVGRLVEKKGLAVLLQAFPSVLAHYPDINLKIAGDGPLAPELRKLAGKLGVASHTEFLGMINHDDLPGLYQKSTALIAPFVVAHGGDQEGLGLVLVEALGCGCPVVASDLPAVRDVLSRERASLVPPGNPDALSKAILELLSDSIRRHRFSEAGLAFSRTVYDWPAVANRYTSIIKDAAGLTTRSGIIS
ncbi:glycosyltransferase family 4 protein [Aquisalimonas lutea]|uniref:glycosyltransferase family 4 protein n=1 Tax=Aquisalimonas lutea TaxID=1327750 RepID=UPI0025B597A6|nr:glycosyltransferase family 4 protein [Aquisalimonas lutea]MDN3516004.1 glycosyltransferase family 4 protein [Aquisalimonas lutea]